VITRNGRRRNGYCRLVPLDSAISAPAADVFDAHHTAKGSGVGSIIPPYALGSIPNHYGLTGPTCFAKACESAKYVPVNPFPVRLAKPDRQDTVVPWPATAHEPLIGCYEQCFVTLRQSPNTLVAR
jgi:hypothetical protein